MLYFFGMTEYLEVSINFNYRMHARADFTNIDYTMGRTTEKIKSNWMLWKWKVSFLITTYCKNDKYKFVISTIYKCMGHGTCKERRLLDKWTAIYNGVPVKCTNCRYELQKEAASIFHLSQKFLTAFLYLPRWKHV